MVAQLNTEWHHLYEISVPGYCVYYNSTVVSVT